MTSPDQRLNQLLDELAPEPPRALSGPALREAADQAPAVLRPVPAGPDPAARRQRRRAWVPAAAAAAVVAVLGVTGYLTLGGGQPAAPASAASTSPSATSPSAASPSGPAASPSPASSLSSPFASKTVEPGSGLLQVSLSPTTGGAGTTVTITGTRCADADGQNHAVSFTPNASAESLRSQPVRVIPSVLVGQSLTATYTVTAADVAAANGAKTSEFTVQCATDLVSAPFHVLG